MSSNLNDEEWVRKAAQIEKDANCDIGAGFVEYAKQPDLSFPWSGTWLTFLGWLSLMKFRPEAKLDTKTNEFLLGMYCLGFWMCLNGDLP